MGTTQKGKTMNIYGYEIRNKDGSICMASPLFGTSEKATRQAANEAARIFHHPVEVSIFCRPWLETPEQTEATNRFYGIS